MRSASFFSAVLLLACLVGTASAGAQELVRGKATAHGGAVLALAGHTIALHGIRMPAAGDECFTWQGKHQVPYACGLHAQAFLESLIADRTTVCVVEKTGAARCYANGQDIARSLVAAGWAVTEPVSNAYDSAQQSARNGQRGMWAGTFSLRP